MNDEIEEQVMQLFASSSHVTSLESQIDEIIDKFSHNFLSTIDANTDSHDVDPRMGFRQAHDARRASAKESAHARQGDPRARSNTDQVGEAREDSGTADQDERQERADGRLQDPGKGSGTNETIH